MLLKLEENPCVILEHIETLDTLDKEKKTKIALLLAMMGRSERLAQMCRNNEFPKIAEFNPLY